MTAISTENALINGDVSTIVSVSSEASKKRLYFSVVATNISGTDAELYLRGEGFGNSPNVLANAVFISAEDYLPNRSQWKYPHKIAVPPSGSITGYVKVRIAEEDWHTLEDYHGVGSETWDTPGIYYPSADTINLSLTYAEVK